jgi:hypothetical protein
MALFIPIQPAKSLSFLHADYKLSLLIPTLSILSTTLLSLHFFASLSLTTASTTAIGAFFEPFYFSLFFSSRQMHSAAIRARSTPGATCTP